MGPPGGAPCADIDSSARDLEAADHWSLVGEMVGAVVGYAVVRAESLRDGECSASSTTSTSSPRHARSASARR